MEQVIDMVQAIKMKKARLLVPVFLVISLAALVLFVVTGLLNTQGFAMACLGIMIVSAIVWFMLLKRDKERSVNNVDSTNVFQAQSHDRTKYIGVAVLLLLLIVASWLTRGGLLVPRLIGASVLVLFLIGTIVRKT